MLKRLLWLTLLAAALLLLLGLFAAQAEAPYVPLNALTARQAALPPERLSCPAADLAHALATDTSGIILERDISLLPPEPPPARAAYHRRCFPPFHYSDRAG